MNHHRIFKNYQAGLLCYFLVFLSGIVSMPIQATNQYPPELQHRLQAALKKQGSDYKPRTELLLPDGNPKYTNRLILESSPYLIQHAHNPVDWFPWGEEAFAKARKENKPVFLSIGYSTCHWCHVMERESFDNEQIASYLNEHFISIKVDREQLPDVDAYFMTSVMLINGQGGWPMSNFLLPDGRPFFGGTYYPAFQFKDILEKITHVWQTRQHELIDSAEKITATIENINTSKKTAEKIGHQAIENSVANIMGGYDSIQGGFSPAPKFPNEPFLFLLLRQMEKKGEASISKAVIHSLDAMMQGGVYDQIGGGFHRYATDNAWLIPHFEKMLYNQAHLARNYLQAYQLTGNPLYERVVRQILDYLLREMKAPEGGFYSATDADSEGEEGLFFVWKKQENQAALPEDLAELAIDIFGVTDAGNFEGRNILYLPLGLDDYAKRHNVELKELLKKVDKIREILRKIREKRIHPLRDDKILTAWNGMVIAALAEAGYKLDDAKYLEEAKQAAQFILQHSRKDSGALYRAYLNGSASIAAAQEDYAYLAEGFLRLYDATGDHHWLQEAKNLADTMIESFWDKQQGGFFMAKHSKIAPQIRNLKEVNDGAIPSGNSVAVRVLAELKNRTGEISYQEKARETVAAFADQVKTHPAAYAYFLLGVDELLSGEVGSIQYAANGAVTARAKLIPLSGKNYRLFVNLDIRPGWHINAHQPLQKDLVATELSLDKNTKAWKLESVIYPEPEYKKLAFQQTELALHENQLQLQATVTSIDKKIAIAPINLTIQACNDQHCLAPESLSINAYAKKIEK